MKCFVKKQDGYILAYVLVIVMVASIIAVAASTTAYRNNLAQKETINYTRDKYAAEGAIEIFAAEIQRSATTYAINLEDKVSEQGLNTAITQIINGYESEGVKTNGVVDIVLSNNNDIADFKFEAKDKWHPESNDFKAAFKVYENEQEDFGDAYFDISLKASSGTVEVEADVRLSFAVEKGGGLAEIKGVVFEYTSYRVSMVSEGGNSDAQ